MGGPRGPRPVHPPQRRARRRRPAVAPRRDGRRRGGALQQPRPGAHRRGAVDPQAPGPRPGVGLRREAHRLSLVRPARRRAGGAGQRAHDPLRVAGEAGVLGRPLARRGDRSGVAAGGGERGRPARRGRCRVDGAGGGERAARPQRGQRRRRAHLALRRVGGERPRRRRVRGAPVARPAHDRGRGLLRGGGSAQPRGGGDRRGRLRPRRGRRAAGAGAGGHQPPPRVAGRSDAGVRARRLERLGAAGGGGRGAGGRPVLPVAGPAVDPRPGGDPDPDRGPPVGPGGGGRRGCRPRRGGGQPAPGVQLPPVLLHEYRRAPGQGPARALEARPGGGPGQDRVRGLHAPAPVGARAVGGRLEHGRPGLLPALGRPGHPRAGGAAAGPRHVHPLRLGLHPVLRRPRVHGAHPRSCAPTASPRSGRTTTASG